jgi:predicted ribosomally synthesized peptide with SipW-like signal peptide
VDEGRETDMDDDDVGGADHLDVTALALGHVDPQRRAEIASHLLVCSRCRTEYDEMSMAVSELLAVVPAVQPPLGFDQQVLARMGIRQTRRWTPSRLGWLSAAAAAVLVIGTVVSLAWWTASDDGEPSAGAVATLELADGGGQVGTVSFRDVKGQPVMVVALVDAPKGVSYRCRTTFSDDTTSVSEPWPAGYGAWIVPLPDSPNAEIDAVELVVDGTDHVWSTASFD